MKVVMVDPSLFTGRYDDALCTALAEGGADVTLAGRALRATDAIEPRGYAYAPRFFRWGERVPGRAPKRLAKALDYACDSIIGSTGIFAGADILHWQWLPLAMADAHWLRRLRRRHALVHTVHNARPFHGGSASANVQGGGYFGLLRQFDALIVHGAETQAALVERGIDVPVHVVPHPPMHLAAASAQDLAAVPGSARPRILFFGTIKPYKGLDLLVDAALTLWQQGVDFDLAIAGQPFMPIDDMLARVDSAGYGDRLILDLGFLTEGRLDAHLRRADVMMFPYRHIDSSGAFLSALDYGAAMITSDCGMFARLPDAAISRFPVGNVAALTEKMRLLLNDGALRQAAGEGARALLRQLGDWNAAAAATMNVYTAACARRNGGAA